MDNILSALSKHRLWQMKSDCFTQSSESQLWTRYRVCESGNESPDFAVVVYSLGRVWHFATNPIDCSTSGFPVHHFLQSLLKLMSIESVMPSNHLILCRPLLLLPSIFPSIRVFPNESALHIRWPKYWRFSISPSSQSWNLSRLKSPRSLDNEGKGRKSPPTSDKWSTPLAC